MVDRTISIIIVVKGKTKAQIRTALENKTVGELKVMSEDPASGVSFNVTKDTTETVASTEQDTWN